MMFMKALKLTPAQKKYVALLGEDNCVAAYLEHDPGGNGGNTIGEGWSYEANRRTKENGGSLFDIITPSRYTKFGDCIVDAGRKIYEYRKEIANIDFESLTLRQQISSRGGGVEINLEPLGYPGEKMTAYQNYLGGGMLGAVVSDCTIPKDKRDAKLQQIAEQLKQYFHALTNPEEGEWEHTSYTQNQNLPSSAY